MKVEDYIIRKLQDFYLWVYDWTGIYVASIATMSVIIGNIAVGLHGYLQFVVLILNISILIPYYIDQDKAKYALFNARAMMLQASPLRYIVVVACATVGLLDFIFLQIGDGINMLSVVFYLQIVCVCIREREPKEWFKEPKLATEKSL